MHLNGIYDVFVVFYHGQVLEVDVEQGKVLFSVKVLIFKSGFYMAWYDKQTLNSVLSSFMTLPALLGKVARLCVAEYWVFVQLGGQKHLQEEIFFLQT